MPKPPVIRLGARHRRWLTAVFALLWSSGVLWLGFHYFLRSESEFGPRPHGLEIWWLRLHGLAAFGALVAIGTLLPIHVRRAWQLRKNRGSGLAMKAVLAWLALTGYALYYFADPEARPWLPWLHWSVGLALPVLLVLHIRRGRQRRGANVPRVWAVPGFWRTAGATKQIVDDAGQSPEVKAFQKRCG
jgi:hypothetical protein